MARGRLAAAGIALVVGLPAGWALGGPYLADRAAADQARVPQLTASGAVVSVDSDTDGLPQVGVRVALENTGESDVVVTAATMRGGGVDITTAPGLTVQAGRTGDLTIAGPVDCPGADGATAADLTVTGTGGTEVRHIGVRLTTPSVAIDACDRDGTGVPPGVAIVGTSGRDGTDLLVTLTPARGLEPTLLAVRLADQVLWDGDAVTLRPGTPVTVRLSPPADCDALFRSGSVPALLRMQVRASADLPIHDQGHDVAADVGDDVIAWALARCAP